MLTGQAMHDEMADLMESAAEVQESMSRTYGVPDELDEADLEAGTWPPYSSLAALELTLLQSSTRWARTFTRTTLRSRRTCHQTRRRCLTLSTRRPSPSTLLYVLCVPCVCSALTRQTEPSARMNAGVV